MSIQKEENFGEDPKLEAAIRKIYQKAQSQNFRYFSAEPTTSDLQYREIGILATSGVSCLRVNIDGTIKGVNLT